MTCVRGDVYRLRAPKNAVGHEQRGERFAILQSDRLAHISTMLVAPTSTSAAPSIFRPEIELDGTTTRVMVEQTVAIAPIRLGDFAGRLSRYELDKVSKALRLVFALSP
ncbi:type II toxin-antitoxin system PemK/MazF family toxin [Streptosporangium sp. NPDC006013]|uniref:type II toxin-antitoxin system PemK/MazF family toxin n=1 Tax=Streptosporangium sp. NPDC006013 TaxID=3155596 RepID=UPI0033A28B74